MLLIQDRPDPLGHAAFLAVGAYTEAVLQAKGAFGVSLSPPARSRASPGSSSGYRPRLTGIYLAIATIAFGFIVQEAVTRWESVTRALGHHAEVDQHRVGRVRRGSGSSTLALALLLVCVFGIPTLRARPPAGRSSRSATPRSRAEHGHPSRAHQDHGVRDFGRAHRLAGALYAHKLVFISPSSSASCCRSSYDDIFIGGIGLDARRRVRRDLPDCLPQPLPGRKTICLRPSATRPASSRPQFGLIMVLRSSSSRSASTAAGSRCAITSRPSRSTGGLFRRQKTFMKSERLR